MGIFLTISLFSQTLVFYKDGSPLPNNSEITINDVVFTTGIWAVMKSNVTLMNTSSSVVQAEFSQTVLVQPEAGVLEICFGGSYCQSTNDNYTLTGSVISGMPENEDIFKLLFHPEVGIYTRTKVRYDVYPHNNPHDKTSVTITYNYTDSGIDKLVHNENISIFKQNNQVYFRFHKDPPPTQLIIYNITGIEVGQYDIDSEIFVLPDNLSKGIYIYAVKEKGGVVYSGKYTQK